MRFYRNNLIIFHVNSLEYFAEQPLLVKVAIFKVVSNIGCQSQRNIKISFHQMSALLNSIDSNIEPGSLGFDAGPLTP